jgi:hypothetical protein
MRVTEFLRCLLDDSRQGVGREALRTEIAKLSDELAHYRQAYETTKSELDRLRSQLAAQNVNPEMNQADTLGAVAPRSRSDRQPVPTIFIVTTPKSGTVYLINLFSKGLGLRYIHASHNGFPSDTLDLEKMKGLRAGNCYSTAHLDASVTNIQMLKYFLGKFVIHIRDPRQAMWSWYHHADKLLHEGKGEGLIQIAPMVPENYGELKPEQRLEWQIANHLPQLVSWTQAWLEAHEADRNRTLICDYEDFTSDLPRYVERVLAFFEIPQDEFCAPEIELTSKIHFRSGDPQEWRMKMPSALLDHANSLVPDTLLSRMGWAR